MSDETLVRFCSPTLAGIKTGSLFSYFFSENEDVDQTLIKLNRRFLGKGVVAVVLEKSSKRALIYLFRPEMLRKDLESEDVEKLLKERGYDTEHMGRCVQKLKEKVQKEGNFPHEIGLFLGYPAEDVRGFIENHARNYKTAGMWKVYGDEDSALETFRKFKKCTYSYTQQWKNGKPLEELASIS